MQNHLKKQSKNDIASIKKNLTYLHAIPYQSHQIALNVEFCQENERLYCPYHRIQHIYNTIILS